MPTGRHFVFDLDGTLVDSLPGIALAVCRALERMGRRVPTAHEVRGMIGLGSKHLCARALGYEGVQHAPLSLMDELHEHFSREYPTCWQGAGTTPFPGIPELLARLAAAGGHMAVLSNKPHEVTLPLVQAVFPEVAFDFIMGYTGQFPRKPAPDALLHLAQVWGVPCREVLLVGDSTYDARTAQAAGCRLALVDWGYARTEELAQYGAPLVSSPAQLEACLGLA